MTTSVDLFQNNITDTALIFEGGGMRASYSAGFLNNLLEHRLYFDYVAGISAGASCSVNYLTRDTTRAKKSFVDVVKDPKFGGWRSFLKGEGYFCAEYIYEQTPRSEASLPFNFEAFKANPAKLRIGAFQMKTGKMKYFSRDDIQSLQDLMKIVRASSSLPIFMPPAHFKDDVYVDGGLGGGVALDIAKKDGFRKFFVVLTRPKGYRKEPVKHPMMVKAFYHKYPLVAEAMLNRYILYNETLEELEELEREGKAFLVYPDVMTVSNMEKDYRKLKESYRMGYEQGRRDVQQWRTFLEME